MRKPCKQCNASGKAEYPGQLVSFTSAPIPCGCGDGFIDVASGVPICTAQQKPLTTNSSLLAKAEVTIDDLLDNDSLWVPEQKPPITTGLDGVDALLGGGWRPGINVALGFDSGRAAHAINSAGSNSLTLTQSNISKRHLLDGEYGKPAFGSGCQPTWDFEEVLGFIRDTTHQLVMLLDVKAYMNTGDWKLDSVRANKLRDVVVESGKTLVMFEPRNKVNQYVQRSADVVLERVEGASGYLTHSYRTIKNRYGEQGSTKKEANKYPVTKGLTLGPKPDTSAAITITVAGAAGSGKSTIVDIINRVLNDYGISADIQGEDRPAHVLKAVSPEHTLRRAEALREHGTKIVIAHKQLPRQR